MERKTEREKCSRAVAEQVAARVFLLEFYDCTIARFYDFTIERSGCSSNRKIVK